MPNIQKAKYFTDNFFARISPQCIDSSLLEAWRSECGSKSSCSFKVTEGFIQMDDTCEGRMEMRTEHLCGKI